jgi:hypothetical protein
MLQAVRFVCLNPNEVIEFFNLPNPSSCTMALRLTHRNEYQKMFLGSRVQLVSKADNLTAICERVVDVISIQPFSIYHKIIYICIFYFQCGNLDISQPYSCAPPVTFVALVFYCAAVFQHIQVFIQH